MPNDKKILIVTPFFYPAWHYGGPPRVMFDLCSAFYNDGYDVTCVTTDVLDNKRYGKNEDVINGIKIKYLKNISNILAYRFKIFLPKGLAEYLDKNIRNFDIVHIVDFRNACTYHAYKACKKYGIPYIITPFGTLPYKKDFRFLIKYIIDKTWGLQCLQKAKCVVVQTENERTEALKKGVPDEKILLVPLMINAEKFEINADAETIRKKFNIPISSKIILFVGRINIYKATDKMILAFERLARENKNYDFLFIIVGRDDGYEDYLKKLVEKLGIKNKVIFAGPIFYPDIVGLYKASDVFFMAPSHFEETSTASLEALASGTPIVVTEQADVPFFNKYRAGFIVKNEVSELTTALKKILIDQEFIKEDCRKIISDNYDIKKIKEIYKNIYFT